MLLAAMLLVACSSPDPVLTGPKGAQAFLEGLPAAEAQACFEASPCAEAPDIAACFATECPERQQAFELVPSKVRWDAEAQLFFLEAHVAHNPAGWGSFDVQRVDPIFVGVTLITAEGEEIDLAIATRFSGAFEEPFFISSEVGKPVQDLIVGVWDRKVEPCDSERPGCQQFGFLLDGPMASWPPLFYTTLERQRITPEVLTIRPRTAGATAADLATATETLRNSLEQILAPFGTQIQLEAPAPADRANMFNTLFYGVPNDLPIARMMLEALGGEASGWTMGGPMPGKPVDAFELVLTGDKAHHDCLIEHCADSDDLAACEAASCQ
jgi:hypothetical protein